MIKKYDLKFTIYNEDNPDEELHSMVVSLTSNEDDMNNIKAFDILSEKLGENINTKIKGIWP